MNFGSAASNRDHWLAIAKRGSRTVNLAWWLETLSAPLLVAAVGGAVALADP